ncbi:hypothetical protein HMPREF0629_00335 [Peptoniphilus sp. oral taxon 386 str. F0131]|nr:hypothetical protein HMPREF0629_00335 [Peptoniphilus sp. oral taxon 386 str. F0131]
MMILQKHLKVEVFIPKEYVVKVANALNERDILKEGHYDYVFALSEVRGHFRPIEGANPFNGEIGVVSELDEVKMEFRIRENDLADVKRIIELNHPYEEPVVNVYELIDL